MIEFNKKQNELSYNIKKALDSLHHGLGGGMNIHIIIAKLSDDEEYEQWNKKGKSDNKKQPSTRYVKKSWKKALIAGAGAVFTIQKHGYRYKTNKNIKNAIDWFNDYSIDHKVEIMSNDSFDLYFIGPLIIETKEDVTKEAHNEEAI